MEGDLIIKTSFACQNVRNHYHWLEKYSVHEIKQLNTQTTMSRPVFPRSSPAFPQPRGLHLPKVIHPHEKASTHFAWKRSLVHGNHKWNEYFPKENSPVGSRLDQTAQTGSHISYCKMEREFGDRERERVAHGTSHVGVAIMATGTVGLAAGFCVSGGWRISRYIAEAYM